MAADLVTTFDSDTVVNDLQAINGELYAALPGFGSVIRIGDGETIWQARNDDCWILEPCIFERLGGLKNFNGELVFYASVSELSRELNSEYANLYKYDGTTVELVANAWDIHQLDSGQIVYIGPYLVGDGSILPFSHHVVIEGFEGSIPGEESTAVLVGDNSVFVLQYFGVEYDGIDTRIHYYDGIANATTSINSLSTVTQAVTQGDSLYYITSEGKLWVLSDGNLEELFMFTQGSKALASGGSGVFFSNGNELWQYEAGSGASHLGTVDGEITSIHVAETAVFVFSATDIWVHVEGQFTHVNSYNAPVTEVTPVANQLYYTTAQGLFHSELGHIQGHGVNVTPSNGDVFFSDGSSVYRVNDTPDVAPTAVADASDITAPSTTPKEIAAYYVDNVAVDVFDVGNNDIEVVLPNGQIVTPSLVSKGTGPGNEIIKAIYSLDPPGGAWDFGDNGVYAIRMRLNEVSDLVNNYVPAGLIGDFAVDISDVVNFDFGDAPSPFPTLLVNDGARHVATGPMLGATRSPDADGIQSPEADTSDDGVEFGGIRVGQLDATATVTISSACWSKARRVD